MNIFKWIRCRAGKMALSTIQTMGLSAVVGAAGIAAWQYLGSPAETNNTFTPAAYDPGEVVYVAGANTGSYAGGSYAGGGESASSVQISTNTFKRLEQQEMARQAEAEMAEYAPDYSSVPSTPTQVYQMGGTEGLGTGANAVNEFNVQTNPMAAMQQQIKGVSDIVARAQQQAQPQPQAPAPASGAPQGLPTLASASKNWGSSAATGGSSGNAFNSSFSVQDSGKNGKESDALKQVGNLMDSAQNTLRNTMEGARLRAQSSFGSENLGGNRDATVLAGGKDSKEARDLKFISKRSNDAAKNKFRAANEGSRAFLASNKISGGLMISSENVTTGQGQGSKDFSADESAQLRGIKTWETSPGNTVDLEQRKKDRDDLRKWVWIAVPLALTLIPWIGAFATVAYNLLPNPLTHLAGVLCMSIAVTLGIAALAPALTLLIKGIGYAGKYGGSALSTWAGILGGILTGAVPCAFIPGVSKLLASMKIWMAAAAPVIGLGASWLTTGVTKDDALDNPEALLNPEIDASQGNGGNS